MNAERRERRRMEGVECGRIVIKLINVCMIMSGTSKRRSLVGRLAFIDGG